MLFLLLVAAVVSSGCVAEKKAGLNESLLDIASHEPEVSSFIAQNPDAHPDITALAPETIAQLSKKYPALYGSLPNKTLYKLEYKGERGLLVIVDLENKKVLKYFRTAGVSLQ
jgi:hypothetical protein